jgi:SAM-dependent methyltransferase
MEARTIESRWTVISSDLKKSTKHILDIGCFEGDFCPLVARQGIKYTGWDISQDSIDAAKERYGDGNFWVEDVVSEEFLNRRQFGVFDTVLMLSIYPYLVIQSSRVVVNRLLEQIIDSGAALYFETQLYGDGPGPSFFNTDDDVKKFLSALGDVKRLDTFQVLGRDATRTIWRVNKRRQKKSLTNG